jgi:hypothetical protein
MTGDTVDYPYSDYPYSDDPYSDYPIAHMRTIDSHFV